ncbi:MAG: alpha/beta hydrolase [Chloroflexota bacterium]
MEEEHVYFRSGNLLLEGAIHWPSGEGPFPAAVVCHPHPLYGGDMDNNVVLAVAQALAPQNTVALRFNFRGVGNSDGSYGDGIGEREDVSSAVSFISGQLRVDASRIAIVGYSFGAFAGGAAAVSDRRVMALVGISPPITMFDFAFLRGYRRPKLLIVGDQDNFVPLDDFREWTAQLPEPKQVHVVPRATHFWVGHERTLSEAVVNFLRAQAFGSTRVDNRPA